jgi:hypothetical protein
LPTIAFPLSIAFSFFPKRISETDRTRDKTSKLIVASSDSVRKRLTLLALTKAAALAQ